MSGETPSDEEERENALVVDYTDEHDRKTALSVQYQELREEIHQLLDQNDRRDFRGIVAIGGIIGYALSAEFYVILASLPLIIGYIFVIKVKTMIPVLYLAHHCAEIEDAIGVDEFSWETDYGGLKENERDYPKYGFLWRELSWSDAPNLVKFIIGIIAYVLSIGVAIYVIWDFFDQLAYRIAVIVAVSMFYIIFSGLLFFVYCSSDRIYESLGAEERGQPRTGARKSK